MIAKLFLKLEFSTETLPVFLNTAPLTSKLSLKLQSVRDSEEAFEYTAEP